MKKLVALAGLIALGLAGVAEAARPAGAGKLGGNSPTSSVTYVVSPLVEGGVEVAGSSVRIDNSGHWNVETTIGAGNYEVCLGAELAPGNDNPLSLGTVLGFSGGYFRLAGVIGVADEGYWLGPTFQIYEKNDSDSDCDGVLIQESGITLAVDGSGLSQYSSPLVDSVCADMDPTAGDCDVESTVLINNRGDWYLATKGLERRTRYDICLDGVLNGASTVPPIFLSDKKSTKRGNFYANGNAADPGRGGAGTWQEMSFLVIKEESTTLNCVDDVVLETGIGITIAP